MNYLYLNGPVTSGLTGHLLRADIRANRDRDASAPISVVINSEGGDVYEGVSIYNMLRAEHVDTVISGMAASIASVIAMAGIRVSMYANSLLYIHHAWTVGQGNATDLLQQVDQLRAADRVLIDAYMAKSGRSEQEIVALMDGPNGDGTPIDAARALELGLIDEVLDPVTAIAACIRSFSVTPDTPHITPHNEKESSMDPEKAPVTPVEPEAACGDPEKAEKILEVKKEVEKKEEAPAADPREERITELEKKVEELTAKLAAMADQAASQAQYRQVVASAHQAHTAKSDEPQSWPEALKKVGFVEACARYPQLRASYIAEINAKSR